MPFYNKGNVSIYYEEAGAGIPLFLIPGGGIDSEIAFFTGTASRGKKGPFNAIDEFKSEYRCITMELRTAQGGRSSGPLDIARPWDSLTEDQLGLLDHLEIDKFLVLGFSYGASLIWNMLKHAPDRVLAAVSAQPSGYHPDFPDRPYQRKLIDWVPKMCARRPDITREIAEAYLKKLHCSNPDFVYTVTRDFVRSCNTPILVLPDDSKAHPYQVAMDMVHLAPNAQVSLHPWTDSEQNIALAIRQIRTFLKAHQPDHSAARARR